MQRIVDEEFERNVFINCPFDDGYRRLLRPLLFVVAFLGFNPKLASERSDSFESRVHKICGLIYTSKFSIHDLSLLQSSRENEFYRLNMPFELGIDYGCMSFAKGRWGEKRCLIHAGAGIHRLRTAMGPGEQGRREERRGIDPPLLNSRG